MPHEQERFWSGQFGDDYILRNSSKYLLAANLHFFARVTRNLEISTVFELGCNIGMNFRALALLLPDSELSGVEINTKAAEKAREIPNVTKIINASIRETTMPREYDFVFTKGVLIHLDPDHLNETYSKMASASKKYVLIAEYFDPNPVMVPYRGEKDKLFKRDFAGEFLKKNNEFRLKDYGFFYKNVKHYSQDNITWFLMERI